MVAGSSYMVIEHDLGCGHKFNAYGPRLDLPAAVLTQFTEMSSEWRQLCEPIPLWEQPMMLESEELQRTSSSQICPVPSPNLQKETDNCYMVVLHQNIYIFYGVRGNITSLWLFLPIHANCTQLWTLKVSSHPRSAASPNCEAREYPSCRQATSDSVCPQKSSQIVPHWPSMKISTRPDM